MPAEALKDAFNEAWPLAEQRLLGWMIREPDLSRIRATIRNLDMNDFCEALHAAIFAHLSDIVAAGRAPTVIALGHALAESSLLPQVGGASYIQGLADCAPATKDGAALASEVRENGLRSRGSREFTALADDFLRGNVPLAETDRRIAEFQERILWRHRRRDGRGITATPLTWIEPEKIPPRRFLFAARHATSGYTSATGAIGGSGKSTIMMAEAIAHATGRNLLRDAPLFQGKSWILGLEDGGDEHQRRFAAALLLHNIPPEQAEGRIFLDTADQGFVVAREGRDGLEIAEPIVAGIIDRIREHGITYLVVDPFVACHQVSENDNGAIDAVARLWGRIARETNAAIDLVHHLRKSNGTEPSADDFRGASALIPAVRSARLFATMTRDEAEKFDIDEPFRFLRTIDAKKNMAARSSKAVWRELVAIDLRNGCPSDHVAAAQAWEPPNAAADITTTQAEEVKARIREARWRDSDKSDDWVGRAIAEVLGLDLHNKSVRADIRTVISHWLVQGVLVKVDGKDAKGMRRAFIEVANEH